MGGGSIIRLRRIPLLLALACGLLAVWASTAHATFPGKNGRIAFASNRDDDNRGNLEIYTMNADGSDVIRLTFDPFPDDDPAWSPDGRKIAFASAEGGEVGIDVMNADGSGRVRVSQGDFYYPTNRPSWSPDGSKLVFTGNKAQGDTELYVVNADGTNQTQLTDNTTGDAAPAWSPDGSKIAFARFVPTPGSDRNFEIFVMNADGTGEVRLTNDPYSDIDPNWSPDGTKMAWGYVNGTSEIRTMNANGTNQRSFSPRALGYQPAWSPDGTKIVWSGFDEPRFTNNEINVMNADGSDRVSISQSPFFESSPDWQPIPNLPPDCSGVAAQPNVLSPANHKFRRVVLGGAADPDGDPVSVVIEGVTQDEPVKAPGDQTSPDATSGSVPNEVNLRAERNGSGNGRVYRIEFSASDNRGGRCSGTATVTVTHDQAKPAIDSAPPSYDSFAP